VTCTHVNVFSCEIRVIKQEVICVCVHIGASSLATVRQFIYENLDWLVSQLKITPLLSVSDADSHITGPVSSVAQQQQLSTDTERPSDDFNPLKMFAYIGSSQFSHVRTNNNFIVFMHYDWMLA